MHYKRPESVLVVIYTAAAEILLLQRCDVPNFWQSVTGSLQETELPRAAAIREVWEETGLIAAENLQDCQQENRFVIQPPWRARYAPEVTHNIEYVFTLLLPSRQLIQLSPQEHSVYQWLPCTQALTKVTSYTNRQAITEWVKNLAAI
ncbi:MAG: dihydroneopterin triphosphate diphosphatase [Beggiatoa sp. IS2]|nr:MAG: dihydroneopterin triphosphate diphosphatase [Beggiatoa sp. IS2]